MKIAHFILLLMISSLITLMIYYHVDHVEIEVVEKTVVSDQVVEIITLPETEVKIPTFQADTYEAEFSINKIDDIIYNRIDNVSFKENDIITIDDLRYLKVTHWGFDQKRHVGELIVHAQVAEEVLEIFKELYEVEYPIEKMVLVDDYYADDNLSMADNNSSAFNYRLIAGTNKLSNHAMGLAIDINPLQNPYVSGNSIMPDAGKDYIDRETYQQGMIILDDPCYTAFTSRGWIWGGSWKSIKDYQHFEKEIN